MPINWDISFAPKKLKYENVILAYIDILGFSNAVAKKSGRFPKRLITVISKLYETLNSSRAGYLQTRFISDSFVIWGESEAITLGFVLDICSRIEMIALLNGFLVRGLIVDGQHYSGRFNIINFREMKARDSFDEIIISPAFIKAYKGEMRLSHPGIMIHKSCRKYLNRPKTKIRNCGRQLDIRPFSTTSVELVAADYFNAPSRLTKRDIGDARRDLNKFRKVIIQGLRIRNKKDRAKWLHVTKSFNRVVKLLRPRIGEDLLLISQAS